MIILKSVVVLVSLICAVHSACKQLPFPKKLIQCLEEMGSAASIEEKAGELISSYCIQQYLMVTRHEKWDPKAEVKNYKFIQNLLEIKPTKVLLRKVRGKNYYGYRPRVRKEYRRLTYRERKNFHKALRKMKRDVSAYPNVYNFFADMHTGDLFRAHNGAAFLGWHRIYIYLFENQMRRYVPDVTLPYWDCSLDFYLSNPEESVIFSKRFAGTGDGIVTNGPFRRWNITRNAGITQSLISKESIASILTRNLTEQIIGVTSPLYDYNLEFQHNGIHVFIGGLAGRLNTAAQDPLFFLLHCFTDYIWELFREKQKSIGIDPSTDYPSNVPPSHEPQVPMLNFTQYSNYAGYANNWTSIIYTYEKSPTCPKCKSRWLQCIDGRCVSKTRPPKQNAPAPLSFAPNTSTSSSVKFVDDKHAATAPTGSCSKITCPNNDKTVQNMFSINGVVDADKWKYIPIKVVYERKGQMMFNSFAMKNGQRLQNRDVFDSSNSATLKKMRRQGSIGTYRNCKVLGSGSTKVFVTSNGISYDGSSLEYVILDDRLPLSSGYVYLPIKDPSSGPTSIILTAFDECGRLCRPLCYTGDKRENPTYVPCTGIIQLDASARSELMYSATAADAVISVWNLPSSRDKNKSPTANDSNVCVTFVCDAVPAYPWERQNV